MAVYVLLVIGVVLSVAGMVGGVKKEAEGRGDSLLDKVGEVWPFRACVPKRGSKDYVGLDSLIKRNYLDKKFDVQRFKALQFVCLAAGGVGVLCFVQACRIVYVFLIQGGGFSGIGVREGIIFFTLGGLIGYEAPVILARRYGSRVKKGFEKELPVMEMYILMLLKSGISIKDMLMELADVSESFQGYFLEAVANYSVDPVRALRVLADRVPDKEFKNIVGLLVNAVTVDDTYVETYLRRHLKTLKSRERLENQRKSSLLENVASVNMLLPLILFVVWGFYPWLVYTLKMLNNI